MPWLLVRAVLGAVWIGVAFMSLAYRPARIAVAILPAIPVTAAAGFLVFGFADQWFGKLFPSRARGDWVMIALGILVGALCGIYIGWLGGRIAWLYWLIQALIVGLFVLVPIWT